MQSTLTTQPNIKTDSNQTEYVEIESNKIIFGPVLSRRFGLSLGVDLSPAKKQCNFDCVYCELSAAKTIQSQKSVVPVKTILKAISIALERMKSKNLDPQNTQKSKHIDVLTFTANGEPTLYPHLLELILESKEILRDYPGIKTLILSNGTRFNECKETLKHFDIVKFSLDSIEPKRFKRVDKPHKSLELERIKRGIVEFSHHFSGELVGEILIVRGINDDVESNVKLAEFLASVRVSRLDISTIDRPSSHKVSAVSNQKLYELSAVFSKILSGLNVCVATRKSDTHSVVREDFEKDAIIKMLKMRPLSKLDCDTLFSQSSLEILNMMLENGEIALKNIVGVEFYVM